jgi:hypothetical protein
MTASFGTALATGVVMIALAVKTDLVSFRSRRSRCGACGRLFRRGTTCPCADDRSA